MKRIGTIICVCVFVASSAVSAATNDTEFSTALTRMYENGLTQYKTFEEFRPDDLLMRQEAAKFFGVAAALMPRTSSPSQASCAFSDASLFDTTLASRIQSSCEQWLVRGRDGAFHPDEALTKAQAIAILIRMSEGMLDESGDQRWSEYVEKAQKEGITKEKDMTRFEQPVTRYEAWLLLYRAITWETIETSTPVSVNDLENEQRELLNLLLKLGLRTE